MILFVHQQRFNLQIFRPKGIRQIVTQRVCLAARQMNTQIQTAVQFIHKLTAVTTRRIVNGDGCKRFFTTQPGVADRALFGMNGLLHCCTNKFHIGTEIPGSAHTARNCANIKIRQWRTRTGRRQWK
ncbi:Uncharacterised protein [Shigella sonnei]|nr:Uncharacterised protein [Shigella sonnei]CSF06920.1 Uncharacterised protein [Shigella sonnei]